MIQVISYKRPHPDVADTQFSVEKGEYPHSDTLVYCYTFEIALACAQALAEPDEPIVLITKE